MFSLLLNYKKYMVVVAIAILVAFCTYRIHKFIGDEQKIGYDKAVAEYTAKALEADKAARIRENTLNVKLQEAQNAATEKDIQIKDLSDNANAVSDKLRNTIAALRRKLSTDPPATQTEVADTSLDVFGECQKRYLDMAEKADRHASDVEMLENAWPK